MGTKLGTALTEIRSWAQTVQILCQKLAGSIGFQTGALNFKQISES